MLSSGTESVSVCAAENCLLVGISSGGDQRIWRLSSTINVRYTTLANFDNRSKYSPLHDFALP